MSLFRLTLVAIAAGGLGWAARAALDSPALPCAAVSAPVRERVVVVRTTEAAPARTAPAATVVEEETDDDALAPVEAAVSDGTWSESDRDLLRQTLPRLGRADRARALSQVAVAINEQRLRLDYDGMPY